MSEAVARLVEMAGHNPNAFRGIGGKDAKSLLRTPEGQQVFRLIGLADSTRRDKDRVGVRQVVGQKRSPEEEHLASMPIEDAFDLLAERDPQLLPAAQDVIRAAEAARKNDEGYAGVRRAVDAVVVSALRRTSQSGLATSRSARQVVIGHLYEIAGVNVIDFQSGDWPGGT